jgi:hypothetical protein
VVIRVRAELYCPYRRWRSDGAILMVARRRYVDILIYALCHEPHFRRDAVWVPATSSTCVERINRGELIAGVLCPVDPVRRRMTVPPRAELLV